jgi:hypothetical protein
MFRYRLRKSGRESHIISPPIGFLKIEKKIMDNENLYYIQAKSIVNMVFRNPTLMKKFQFLIPEKSDNITTFSHTLAARSNSFTCFPLIHFIRQKTDFELQIGSIIEFPYLNNFQTNIGQIFSIYKDNDDIKIDVHPFLKCNSTRQLKLDQTNPLTVSYTSIIKVIDKINIFDDGLNDYCIDMKTTNGDNFPYRTPKKVILPKLNIKCSSGRHFRFSC